MTKFREEYKTREGARAKEQKALKIGKENEKKKHILPSDTSFV
jgi:hypothetical protein